MCKQNNIPEENGEVKSEENVTEESVKVSSDAESATAPAETLTSPKKKKSVKKIVLRVVIIILLVLLALIAAVAITILVMRNNGKKSLKVDDFSITPPTEVEVQTDPDDDTLIYYNGNKYDYKDDVVAFVVMGVDKESINEVVGPGDNGQADVVFLVVADPSDGSVDMVSVSRDSVVEVDRYTTTGRRDGSDFMQLCLAYAYGDGKETSCENVCTSVSRLFYGIPISGYVAIDLDAISVLTDAVGGVSVPEYNSELTEKTGNMIDLTGDGAETYLRRRNVDLLDSNVTRMERQNYYLNAFVSKAVSETKRDFGTPLDIYNALTDYMVTDITPNEVVYLATEYLTGVENLQRHSVEGSVSEGEDGYAEFTPEPVALYEMVLELFYEKK